MEDKYRGVTALFNGDLHLDDPDWAPRDHWLVISPDEIRHIGYEVVAMAEAKAQDGPVELWRQDDNGNKFLMDVFENPVIAEEYRLELEERGHKQMYWLESVEKNTQELED